MLRNNDLRSEHCDIVENAVAEIVELHNSNSSKMSINMDMPCDSFKIDKINQRS